MIMKNPLNYLNKQTIKKGISSLQERGFFSIFFGSVIVKMISFCSTLLLPRIIADTSQYGILSIVDNFNSYLILVSGLGLQNSILRFCVIREKYKDKRAVFNFCLNWGTVINGIALVIAVFIIFNTNLGIDGLRKYLFIAVGIPMINYFFDCISLFLRADMKNREYARLSVFYTLFYAGFQVIFAIGLKVYGAILGRYIGLFLTVLIGIVIIKKRTELFNVRASAMTGQQKKEIISFALVGLLANSFSVMMPLNEQMVLTAVVKDEVQVAYYRAAYLLPSNLQFIANAVITFVYPYFIKNMDDIQWVWKKTKHTVLALSAIILPIAIILSILSPQVIKIIFGDDYLPAVGMMRMMWIAFSINSIFRMPLGSILGAIGRIKFNAYNAGITAVLHLILDYYFITSKGVHGAAYGLTIAYIFAGILNLGYFLFILKKGRNCNI